MARTNSTRMILTAGIIAVMAGAAFGQADAKPDHDGKHRQKEANPLKGPKVRTTVPPGGSGKLIDKKDKYQTRATPLRVYSVELRKMSVPSADASIKLSESQATEIRAITMGHMQAVREHMKAHGQEVGRSRQGMSGEDRDQLMERRRRQIDGQSEGDAKKRQRSGDQQMTGDERRQRQAQRDDKRRGKPGEQTDRRRGEASSDMSPEEQKAQREKMAEIRKSGPSDQDAVKRIWSLLNESQRTHLAAKVDEQKQRSMDVRLRMDAEDVDVDAARERFRKRLENMPPEQREEALRRLREDRAGDAGDRKRPGKQQRKRAPKQDDAPDSDG